MDFHRNVFYYYRGPARERSLIDRQLENNTTKALVNVLENCTPTLTMEFLRWLGVDAALQKTHFELQRETIGERRIQRARKKLLLDLVRGPSAENVPCVEGAPGGSSLPDAWIYGDGFVVLVESKLGPKLNAEQRACHMKLLGVGAEERRVTWQEVHKFFNDIPGLADVDHFLVQQFTRYLEYTGMATTSTVTKELFDFLLNPEDAEGKRWVRETMRALARTVADKLERPSLQVNVGNIQGEPGGWYSCWVTLSRSEHASTEAHTTIELLPYELNIYANVDTATIRRLFKGLEKRPEAFRAMLANLEGFDITVNDRRRSTPQPRKFEYVPVMKFRSGSYIADETSFNHLVHLLRSLRVPGTYPSFSVTKSFMRHEVLEMRRSLPERLVRTAHQLQPIVRFVNEQA
jgi:hypothetical protein